MIAIELAILAIMNIVGPTATTKGLISKFQNAAVDAASNMLRTAAAAHHAPLARLIIHPPQNMVTPMRIMTKPSKRPVTRMPKPEAPKTRPSTKRRIAHENMRLSNRVTKTFLLFYLNNMIMMSRMAMNIRNGRRVDVSIAITMAM